MSNRTAISSAASRNSADGARCALSTDLMARTRNPDGNAALATAPARAEVPELLAASELLVSFVESSWKNSANGSGTRMNGSGSKAQQELEKIEQQIAQIEAVAGQHQDATQQLHELHERVHALRREIVAHMNAWQKTELARHP